MTKFRTELPPLNSGLAISHQERILCIGSCFAEHIYQKLEARKFTSLLNPFGIIYNPASIAKSLYYLSGDFQYSEQELIKDNAIWHSFDHHSQFSNPDKGKALAGINAAVEAGQEFLKQTSRLVITLGTANVFIDKKTKEIVANCHKIPANQFERKRLSTKQVIAYLLPVFEKLHVDNSQLKIIITVSPIRHIRDGLIENQRSKANLILAVENLADQLEFVHYFPSYELMMDDLRDYRFYDGDLIHPNQTAIDYIWDYFKNAFFTTTTTHLIRQIEKITLAARHRPFLPESAQHQAFLNQQLGQIDALNKMHPELDFEKEKHQFRIQLL